MLKSIVGWILATASLLLGVLIFFGVIDFFPAAVLGGLFSGIGRGIGWLFGTALPTLGDIILDRLRSSTPSVPPTTTTTIP
jgi:hypothetical protein